MGALFHALLDEALSEIYRRDPGYLTRFPLSRPQVPALAARYADGPHCHGHGAATVERALAEGLEHLAQSVPMSPAIAADDDPLVEMLCGSIVDAFSAGQDLLPLRPAIGEEQPAAEIFTAGYNIGRTAAGHRYFVRRRGSRPLLLVNATGTPIDTWWRFLGDPEHDFQLIVPERPHGDLFAGGLQHDVDIASESKAIASVLDAGGFAKVDVVAWCNGARLALDLAARYPGRVASLVLLTPMFKGPQAPDAAPSAFERDLQLILDAVAKKAEMAAFFQQSIAAQIKLPDWDYLARDPKVCADTLLGLPARSQARSLLAPMLDSDSLINVSRRVRSDETHPTCEVLAALPVPLTVIMGTHDTVVSNAVTQAMMRSAKKTRLQATVSGGGHYIYDLQYPYFRFLLTELLVKNRPPPSTARVAVEQRTA